MKLIVPILALLCLWLKLARGVQPMPDGLRIQWEADTNAQSFNVWMATPGSTNWNFWLTNAPGTSTNFFYAGAVADNTHFGVTVVKKPSCLTCVAAESDIGQAAWPPNINAGPGTVRVTPAGGVRLATNQWARVSYDLVAFSDLLRVHNPAAGVVKVEHAPSGARPYLFMAYPTVAAAPAFSAASATSTLKHKQRGVR